MKPLRLYLAPIRGITDWVFRTCFAQFFQGLDLSVAPFIATVQANRFTIKLLKDLLPENNQKMPVVPQLLGKSAEDFIRLARALYDLGYDCVNWNLGCPAPMVARKGRGSGLLLYPEKIEAFLESVVPAIPNRLSIKTRLGRTQPAEIQTLMTIFNRFPLKELIVHPRTGSQIYTGQPDLEMFAWCCENSQNPLVYNGDIVDTHSFQELFKRFPEIHGWMIGRGVVADPFLPAEIKAQPPVPPTEKVAIILKFHDALYESYSSLFAGPAHLTDRMKAVWQYLHRSFEGGEKFVKRIRKCRHTETYQQTVQDFFVQGPIYKDNKSLQE